MKSQIFIGIYLLLALLALCAIPVIFFFSDSIQHEIIRIIVYVGASGGIGGTVYSIRGFYSNTGGETFKSNWIWWYIFRPLISVVAGVFTYFFIVGGLMSISTSPEVSLSKGILFYCSIAFLAGYSFSRFLMKVDAMSDQVFSSEKEDKGKGDDTENVEEETNDAGADKPKESENADTSE